MAVRPKDTRPHVIVVEDEQFQRETLVDFLDENGYRASGVDSGMALRKLVEAASRAAETGSTVSAILLNTFIMSAVFIITPI